MASSTDRLAAEAQPPLGVGAPVPWALLTWFGLLLVICYFPILRHLTDQWLHDDDMGHGIFVPFVAGYIAWRRRDLMAGPAKTNYWGLVVVLFGAMLELVGMLGAQIVIQRVAFLVSLTGVVFFLGGARALRVFGFPLFLLLFMIPIPAVIYGQITLPLQLFATQVAETLLGWMNIPVLRDGNILELASQRLNVVEACSGIRSLMTLTFLALTYAYLFDKKPWMRWALLAATVPIAILTNALRVTITGALSEIRTDLAEGFYHEMEGFVIFLMAFAFMIGMHHLLNFVYRKCGGKEPA